MLKKRIIPCLDIQDGRTVKGINFIGIKDAGDPIKLAQKYVEEGADELVFLDIAATIEKRETLLALVKNIAEKIDIPFTVGGGIRSVEDAAKVIAAGADKVSINTAAIKNINFVKEASKKFGTQCMVVAVDAKKVGDDRWEIFTHGGREKTGLDAIEFSKKAEANGAGEILLTSMDKDGTKTGYDIELLNTVTKSINIPVIASGGAGSLEHLYDAIKSGGASAVLAASIFHYGEYTIKETKEYLKSRSVPIRL